MDTLVINYSLTRHKALAGKPLLAYADRQSFF